MRAIETFETAIPGIRASDSDTTTYESQNCGNVTESAEPAEGVRCLDCVSDDVEPA